MLENNFPTAEEELRNILRNMQDTYYRTDNTGKIIRVSESVENLLGYLPDELLGTQLADCYPEPTEKQGSSANFCFKMVAA